MTIGDTKAVSVVLGGPAPVGRLLLFAAGDDPLSIPAGTSSSANGALLD
jgi:hypothetical protein